MENEINQAQLYLQQIDALRQQEQELKANNDYLPKKYNSEEIEQQIQMLTEKIDALQERIIKLREQSGDSTQEVSDSSTFSILDEIVLKAEQLILIRDNFEKYKHINAEKERILVEISCSLTTARDSVYAEIFNDSLNDSKTIDEFINGKCLSSDKLRVPFMVALLTHDPNKIYEEIINSTEVLTQEQRNIVKQYIESQKRRIEQNLVLSDTALISLLETTTGKNILRQEEIKSRARNEMDYYRRMANQFCKQIPALGGQKLTTSLTVNNSQQIINALNNMAASGLLPEYTNLSTLERNKLIDHIRKTESNLQQEIILENHQESIAVSQNGKGKKYDISKGFSNRHSLDGETIKRFSSGSTFLRTIDDMQVSNFPANSIANFIGESFASSKVPRYVKQQMIAVVLDNLQLCYDMFKSYYLSGNGSISSYITLSNDLSNPIELNQPLNNNNIQHLLGIPTSHNRDTMALNLPHETLDFLGLDPNVFHSASEVLNKILENKEKIINNCICGCYRGNDGHLHEMLPWEKIILKTNAFIRGDFFKTTSLISTIHPDAYMTSHKEKINAVALNSTLYNESAVFQKIPDITTDYNRSPLLEGTTSLGGQNSLHQRNKDMILKGLIVKLKQESSGIQRISKIDGVVTNESFIGERLRTSNGTVLRTMNQPAHLLQNINPANGGVVVDVINQNGIRSTKSLDENILLLEDLVLTFEDVEPVVELAHEIVGQLKQVYGHSSKKK